MNAFPRHGGIGGCIVQRPTSKPSPEGTTVYLNALGTFTPRRGQRLEDFMKRMRERARDMYGEPLRLL